MDIYWLKEWEKKIFKKEVRDNWRIRKLIMLKLNGSQSSYEAYQ